MPLLRRVTPSSATATARVVLAAGESGNFPAAVKVTAEYFPKKDRAFATSIFNSGATIGALIAPLCIPTLASYFKRIGIGNGWEIAFNHKKNPEFTYFWINR